MFLLLVISATLLPVILWIGFRSLFNAEHARSVRAVKEGYRRVVMRKLLSISKVNMFGPRLIGIDEGLNMLVSIIYKDGITWEKCIDLRRIVLCKIVKQHDSINGLIRKVELELTLAQNNETFCFPFFDEEIDEARDLAGRVKKAQAWRRRIQMQLSKMQVKDTYELISR